LILFILTELYLSGVAVGEKSFKSVQIIQIFFYFYLFDLFRFVGFLPR